MYGELFSEMRHFKKFTLKELTVVGVSKATSSRFENNQADLGINKIEAMLRLMNVSMGDLINLERDGEHLEDSFDDQNMELYLKRAAPVLKVRYENEVTQYQNSKNQEHFEHLATLANLYLNLTGSNLLTPTCKSN